MARLAKQNASKNQFYNAKQINIKSKITGDVLSCLAASRHCHSLTAKIAYDRLPDISAVGKSFESGLNVPKYRISLGL